MPGIRNVTGVYQLLTIWTWENDPLPKRCNTHLGLIKVMSSTASSTALSDSTTLQWLESHYLLYKQRSICYLILTGANWVFIALNATTKGNGISEELGSQLPAPHLSYDITIPSQEPLGRMQPCHAGRSGWEVCMPKRACPGLYSQGRCLHIAHVATALGAFRADALEASPSVDTHGPAGTHVLLSHTLINIWNTGHRTRMKILPSQNYRKDHNRH